MVSHAAPCALLVGCSNHQVSPWGPTGPSLAPFIAAPDLPSQLAAIDAEVGELGLALRHELVGRLPGGGGPLVVRAYDGADAVHRPIHAVRAATARGVVLALGPLDARDEERRKATELVVSLLPAAEGDGAWRSATDLNRDGRLDVVLKNEAGELEIWGIGPTGAGAYELVLAVRATRVEDIDGDGLPDFAGQEVHAAGDPLAPLFDDVATFDGARYVNTTAAARGEHRRKAAVLRAAVQAEHDASTASSSDGGASPKPAPAPEPPSEATRLRRALELAWHALLAGEPRDAIIARLDQEPVSGALRASFAQHRATLVRLRVTPTTSGSRAAGTPGGT
jgi:hypothetical protein